VACLRGKWDSTRFSVRIGARSRPNSAVSGGRKRSRPKGRAPYIVPIAMANGNNYFALLLSLVLVCGCRQASPPDPGRRAGEAKILFESTVKEHHLPSAELGGAKRLEELRRAAQGYEKLLKEFPEQTNWCAQALRSLGNARAAIGQLESAIQCYTDLDTRYPTEEWEILQAWKSAGDLLWEANRRPEARKFYERIVNRFDRTNAAGIVRTVVKGAKDKLVDNSTH
jgi:tetratricopeptide (TPR) repeat protein